MSLGDCEILQKRPDFSVNTAQFNALGMIKIVARAIQKHGPIVTLCMENGQEKTVLSQANHNKFWRENEHLFFKDLTQQNTTAAMSRAVLGRNLLTLTEADNWDLARKNAVHSINDSRAFFDRSLVSATQELQHALVQQGEKTALEHCVAWSRKICCDAIFGTPALEDDAEALIQSFNQAFLENLEPSAIARAREKTVQLLDKAKKSSSQDSLVGQILIQGQNIDARLESEVIGFLAASLHINALSLFWTLLQIAKEPDVKIKLAQEARPLGTELRRISNAPYAFAVAQEAQRLRPSMAFIERQISTDFTLDGMLFKRGETVLFSPWFTHLCPDVWANPDVFDPSRFLEKNDIVAGSFLPFGLGQRMCPGSTTINRHIAYAISRLALCVNLDVSEKTRPGDLAPIFRINTEPRGPVFITASPKELDE